MTSVVFCFRTVAESQPSHWHSEGDLKGVSNVVKVCRLVMCVIVAWSQRLPEAWSQGDQTCCRASSFAMLTV